MFGSPCETNSDASALSLYSSYFPGMKPNWEDMIVAQDFELLQPREVMAWFNDCGLNHLNTRQLEECSVDFLLIEKTLWTACKEMMGSVPRPGSNLWEIAHDRWRIVFLKDSLNRYDTAESLGNAVKETFEKLGYPEDMFGLWTENPTPVSLRNVVEKFVNRIEKRLSLKLRLSMPMAS